MLPNSLKKPIEVQLHIATDNHSIRLLRDEVNLFHRNGVDLVVAV